LRALIVVVAIVLFAPPAPAQTMINVNQVGYLPDDVKTAVIASQQKLDTNSFRIARSDGEVVFTGELSEDAGEYLAFKHHYLAHFSKLKRTGEYRIEVNLVQSPPFSIGKALYAGAPDSLLRFFRIQRCGENDALLHSDCHTYDVNEVMSVNGISTAKLDLTSGWHDAGDYIKFNNTTAYSSYLLLLTAELFPSRHSQMHREARIGLEWLLKMHPTPDRLLSQVQGIVDHKVGWRMPENDPLEKQRVAYEYPSQAQAGMAAAALASGAKAFKRGDSDFSERCLKASEELYALALSGRLPAIATPPDSHYFDREARDNIALAAAELYAVTQREEYLDTAKAILTVIGAGGWVSWGDVEGFACYRAGQFWAQGADKLQATLERYEAIAVRNPYSYPAGSYPWGSLALQTGVADLAILYHKLTGSKRFDALAARQRDFLLGANPFGVSLVSNMGTDWPRRFHHQISSLKGVQLPGGVAGGLIDRKSFEESGIRLEAPDRFSALQSDAAVFHDDRMDFLCNEPTISGVAQAILLLAYFGD